MESKLKQRLVGAVILISLAVIIVPLLLDGNEAERRQMLKLPARPDIELNAVTVDGITAKMEQMERSSASRLPQEVADDTDYASLVPGSAVDSADPSSEFMLDKNNLPVSWVLQLGSFESRARAVGLREQLQAANFRSHIQQSEAGMFRVLVGPMVSKQSLTEISRQIEKTIKARGVILPYDIADSTKQVGG